MKQLKLLFKILKVNINNNYHKYMKIKRIEFMEEITDEDGYKYIIGVEITQDLLEEMNQEKANYV